MDCWRYILNCCFGWITFFGIFLFFLIFTQGCFFIAFREREGERMNMNMNESLMWERNINQLPSQVCSHQGLNPQLRHAPWLGIEPTTSFCGMMLQPTEPLWPGLDSLEDPWENAVWSERVPWLQLVWTQLGFPVSWSAQGCCPYTIFQKKKKIWGHLLALVRLLSEALTAFNYSEEVSGLLHSIPLCVRARTRDPWEIMRYYSHVTRCFCSELIWGDGVGWGSYIKQSFGNLSLLIACYV